MPAINSVIFLLLFFVASITSEPIFFGGRRGRKRPIPTLPPLPSRFRLGSHRAAPRFTVKTQYIDAPALKSFQNSIDTKKAPSKENTPKESDIISLADIADISGEIIISDDIDAVTEVDVEDSTATEASPVELRELKSEVKNNKNVLLNENTKQKLVTDTLLDFNSENVILDSIFTQNITEQSLVTDSFFTVINEKATSDIKIPNFVKPPEVIEHFTSQDIKIPNFVNPTEVVEHFTSEDVKIPNFVNPTEVVEHFTSEDVKIPNFVKKTEILEQFISDDIQIPNFVKSSEVVEHFTPEDIKIPNFVKSSEVGEDFTPENIKIPNFVKKPEIVKHFTSEDNSNKISTQTPKLLPESVTETVAKHIIQEFTTTESVTFTHKETESIIVTETAYASISYTPVFITVTDLVVETDCITVNLPNTVTEYDTETVTTRLTEYIQYSQITVPAIKTVTDTIYSTTTVTPSPFSIVQTITDLLQIKTCTCVHF